MTGGVLDSLSVRGRVALVTSALTILSMKQCLFNSMLHYWPHGMWDKQFANLCGLTEKVVDMRGTRGLLLMKDEVLRYE